MGRALAIIVVLLSVCASAMAATPAFKTQSGTRPGDWVRLEQTMDSLGTVERRSLLMEALENAGGKITLRMTLANLNTGETRSAVIREDSAAVTIEDTLFSDVRLGADEAITKAPPGRETLTVAGRALDCAVLSATASPRKGVIGGLFRGLSSGTVTESRVWYSPEVPFLGIVKKEAVSKLMRGRDVQMSFTYRTELKEWGDASRPPAR